ncbi:MAG: ParA family protein [Candidatus Saccharimonadales bacterium]
MARHIIAVINQKGGVGKTTTVVNLAIYLKKLNKKVLVVDIDPQGNATTGLGVDKQLITASTKELMLGARPIDQIVLHAEGGVHLIPTSQELASLEIELVDRPDREFRLRRALERSNYDYILIDCPPSLSLLTVNALTAADSILIPVQAEYYALEGLSQLLEVVELIKRGLNPNIELLGVLLTMYDRRTTLAEQVRAEVEKHFGDKVFTTVVPRNVRLAEAPSYGMTIHGYDKWSKGARAYHALAKEVHSRAITS